MSLLLIIGLITLSEIVFGFLYGFWLQYLIPYELFLTVAFVIAVILFLSLWKHHHGKTMIKVVEIFALSMLLLVVAPITYDAGNRLSKEMITQYDVVVESVYGRGGGRAEFTAPDGCSAEVELHDYRVVLTDEYVEVGDTIRVQEYRGLFKQPYYVFVEEIQK